MEIVLKKIDIEFDVLNIYSLLKDEEDLIILDSQKNHNSLGRYSFVGLNSFKKLSGKYVKKQDDIFNEIDNILKEYRVENNTEIPFIGGGIGYFSYDIGLELENIQSVENKKIDIPDYNFIFYDNLIIIDNKEKNIYISACGILEDQKLSIEKIEERVKKVYIEKELVTNCKTKFISNFTKEEYIEIVERAREYIAEGDVYIVNLAQTFCAITKKTGFNIFKELKAINPAPFATYMKFRDFEVISTSPERFMQVVNNKVQTRPIKGTRPRGDSEKQDRINKEELLKSEKDKAELLMIVDLERNDLSKVCKSNSIKVTELFKLEEHSTVFHLVANVEGVLKDSTSAVDCVKACFPGGSISGAPKIRAMEIIDELEKTRRTLYTGCIGYFSFDGNSDFNIAIRTILKQGEQVSFGVGGGITWDSNANDEYNETLDKAKALMEVL